MTSYFPNYDLAGRIQHTKYASGFNMPSIRFDRVEKPETQDFKQVFSGLVENFNNELNAPDDLLKDVMQGNKNVDIHDVMVAMSKTEISVNIATQAVGKVINAYDRIMQINI
jgi:flagellar hook-basal body complex protein FliE